MLRFFSFQVFRRYGLHARLLWRCAPRWSLLCLASSIVVAGTATVALVTTGRLVGALPAALEDGFGSRAAETAWIWLLATATVFVIGPVANAVLAAAAQAVAARYQVLVLDMLMEVGTHPYGVAHLEEPRSAGELAAVARAPRDWLFIAGIHTGWTLLSIRLGGIGAVVVLAGWSWWAPICLAAGWLVSSRGFARWSNTIFDDLLDVTGNARRRADYLRSLLTDAAPAKEVRLFGLTDWLVGRFTTAWQEAMRLVWANRVRGLRVTLLVLLVPLAVYGVVVAALARDAWTGTVSGGALVTFAQAALAMSAFGAQREPQSGLARTMAVVSELARLRSREGLPLLPSPPARTAVSATERRGGPASVVLRDVTFGYPSEERPTLSRLSLEIPAGQSIALVGVNGVGKSTLIKLLCGLYRADQGTVRVDGEDPGVSERARRRVAVIFQDFVRYHLSLRDNVAAGATGHEPDDVLVRRALADAGGAAVLASLEFGWDTVLSAEYAGGTDLSGGQWQRVALARALAALDAGAGVLVLDEPTAALDVRAEAALFDRFLEVTRGATTLLVSHRLSSVRHAERIVVLGADHNGGACVVEDGGHEELLANDGSYAELFTLQASRFVADTVAGTVTDTEGV